jgi:hypothetical protein
MARVSERKDDSRSESGVRCKRRVRRSSRLDEDQATEPETCLPMRAFVRRGWWHEGGCRNTSVP